MNTRFFLIILTDLLNLVSHVRLSWFCNTGMQQFHLERVQWLEECYWFALLFFVEMSLPVYSSSHSFCKGQQKYLEKMRNLLIIQTKRCDEFSWNQWFLMKSISFSEAYLKPSQTFTMELLCESSLWLKPLEEAPS